MRQTGRLCECVFNPRTPHITARLRYALLLIKLKSCSDISKHPPCNIAPHLRRFLGANDNLFNNDLIEMGLSKNETPPTVSTYVGESESILSESIICILLDHGSFFITSPLAIMH